MPRMKKQHLKKRSDGRYACRYKDKWFMGNTEDEALEAREQYKRSEGKQPEFETVSVYAKHWLKVSYPTVAKSTFTGLEIHLEKLLSRIGNMKLSDVKPLQIKQVYSSEYAGLSNSYILSAKQLYCSLFDSAVADGYCNSNPARAKSAQPHKGTFGGHRQITEQERFWIENLCKDHRAYPAVMAMLYAGLRPQEAKAIDIDRDIDFDAETITVRETAHINGQKYAYTEQGKTDKANRQIPLLPPLKQALYSKHGYLISTKDGERVTVQSWKVMWRSYVHCMETAINGTPKEWYGRTKAHKAMLAENKPLPVWKEFLVTPYDLRHSFCCMLRDLNPPIELHTCIRWMGHADATMILKVYDEASDQRSEKEAERLKKALIGSQNGRQISDTEPETVQNQQDSIHRAFGSYPECHRFESYLSHMRKPSQE